jgi:hypothetical protein
MARMKLTRFDEEFGKAVCDRLGLPHDMTLRDWTAEAVGHQSVFVKMEVFKVLTEAEMSELRAVAEHRAAVIEGEA